VNQVLVNRYRNALTGIFSSENADFTLVHYFNGNYYINEPKRLQNGKLYHVPTNWKIFNEKKFERYIEHYEEQLLSKIEQN